MEQLPLIETRPTFQDPIYRRPRGRRPVETVTLASRIGDPETSDAAAASITPGRTEAAVLLAFEINRNMGGTGLTDDELMAILPPTAYKPTFVTARSRLSKAGLLVDSGKRGVSARGRSQIAWRLKP